MEIFYLWPSSDTPYRCGVEFVVSCYVDQVFALVSVDPTVSWPGKNLEVHLYKTSFGACAAFLANYDTSSWAKVPFGNGQYDLPPWSISILPDCKTEVFNTAKVGAPRFHRKMTPINNAFNWQSYNEQPAASGGESSITTAALLEQVGVTRDSSDYLWYMIDVNISPNEAFLKNGQYLVLTAMSVGHVLHVFVNGQLSGTAYGGLDNPKLTFSSGVKLWAGNNNISLLSVAVGLSNVGLHYETWNVGVLGPVTLKGLNKGERDLSKQKWSYKTGLKGESLNLHTATGSSAVKWSQGSFLSKKQSLTWYKETQRSFQISPCATMISLMQQTDLIDVIAPNLLVFQDTSSLILDLCCKEDRRITDRVAVMIECLWKNINDLVWDNEKEEASKFVGFDELEFTRYIGWLKCNVDASFNHCLGTTSRGWCLRDDHDIFVTTSAAWDGGTLSVIEAEALALKETIQGVISLNHNFVVFESDSQKVIHALRSNFLGNS
ncbi:unnamed protein product [Vicia faba]|uniref:Beta-galactosidase n=1 Tax=Vicia faba TaxID=3906 RepID=A0AAV0YDZ6_VICFA|nr:unnamed protein product [Vicia faba]